MYSDTPDVVECLSPHPIALTSYADINGRRHQHSPRLKVLEEHRELGTDEQARREVALAVQTFWDDHHHTVGAGEADPID